MKTTTPTASHRQKKQPYIVREIDARMLRKHPELSKGARMLWLTMLSMANAKTGELRHREHWYCGKEIDRRAEISDRTRQQQMKELVRVGLVRMERERTEAMLTDRLTGRKRWRSGVLGEVHYFVFKSPHKDWFSYTAEQKSPRKQRVSTTRQFSEPLESRNTPNKTEGQNEKSPHKQRPSTTRKFYHAGRISATSTSVLHQEGGVGVSGSVFEGSTLHTVNETPHPPVPARPVELRQDHKIPAIQVEPQQPGKGGSPVLSLAVFQHRNHYPSLPPVIAYLQKHGKLPEYIVDETHLCFDADGNYIGYIDRGGKRRDAWNNFESIQMAMRRRSNEALREAFKGHPSLERKKPEPVSGKEKMRMLRKGASSEAEAEEWSAITEIPAHIFLVRDYNERADAFARWKGIA